MSRPDASRPVAQQDEPTLSEAAGVRYLHFNSPWIQGAMQIRRPHKLYLAYTQQMMAWLLFLEPESHRTIAQLGLGAASITRFCHHYLPNPLVVVERNAAVTAVCERYFRLPHSERLTVVHEDAASWVVRASNRSSAGVLMVDLYDSEAQGPVCDSLQFYRHCERVLESPGILSVNLFGHHASYERNLDRLAKAFGSRLLIMPQAEEGNQVVLAFKGPPLQWDRESMFDRADALERRFGLPARRWARSLGQITDI